MNEFEKHFKALTGHAPFPWQQAMYDQFVCNRADNIPTTCNIPTGLGKTNIIAIWLIALVQQAKVPRRLVYVVNRRTVVDQTTTEAIRLRDNAPKIGINNLAISTLRGQFADNREWAADPSRPAIICGTVDMIGSRLLFSGYGVGFKSKPLHAGFLGQDVLIVHDESHLEPAFQDLLIAIQSEQCLGRFPDRHPLRVMALSATSRGGNEAFELTEQEKHADFARNDAPAELRMVWQRTHARKSLAFHTVSDEKKALVERTAELALAHKDSERAILIFVRTVDNLADVVKKLPADQTCQLTGTMRGHERDKLIDHPIFKRFLPGAEPEAKTAYLVCTSAGEVGVNISADHLVCDLSTFESMAQRFGRVNRFGLRDDTRIDIVHPTPTTFDDKDKLTPTRQKTLALLTSLTDASPASLSKLDPVARSDAFAPRPITLPTSDILFDAWSMTSIRERMPGRPKVEPYMHGIREWEPPQTKVGWREEVAKITGQLLIQYRPSDLLDVYPIKPHELLTDRTDRVFNTLKKLASLGDWPIWIGDDEGHFKDSTLSQIVADGKESIEGVTLLLPPELGGLDRGFFTASAKYDPAVPYDVADEWRIAEDQLTRKRKWTTEDESDPKPPTGMKRVQRIIFTDRDDEDEKTIKTWHWFVRFSAADPDARSRESYDLQPHLDDAKAAATGFVDKLLLEPELRKAVILAATYHDLGKDRERWQNGIGNREYPDKKWAKSGNRTLAGERSSYRHEFGSVLDVQKEPSFQQLSDDAKDLVLHLIAAHHGRARPHFNADECFDDNHAAQAVRDLAVEVPRRFARLQRKFGRWGLAYLESLVRAADYAASIQAEGGAK